ncbi:MAG: IS200/IS605 family transposase [Muribaculaceae bacterium]|nr:IS200/IS605 family transposase [Muribaculaceae bacterium]
MSHASLTYHIVFGTYRRQPVIVTEYEKELYRFIYNLLIKRNIYVRRIGGMPDHIHILCDIPPKYSVAETIKVIKSESSKFLGINRHFPNWIRWARRYGCFTVDAELREVRKMYIMNQKSHHSTICFVDEYRSLLNQNGFPLDTPVLGDENDCE